MSTSSSGRGRVLTVSGSTLADAPAMMGVMTSFGRSAGSARLVGRDAELTDLVQLVAEPGRRHVLLGGEAGVGKTRLLDELDGRLRAAGWQVLTGHCLDFGDSALPYLPLSELLGGLRVDDPEVVEEALAAHPGLARALPGRRGLDRDRSESESADKGALFEGVRNLLETLATRGPVAWVVEDAHWADHSTRELLTFLFTRPFEGPVSIVVSYRADDLHRRHPLRRHVAEWGRLPAVQRRVLEPLPDPEVRALIEQLDADVDAASRERIVRRAEGNAFFVEELVGAASGPDRWVPEELADLLLLRLDRLDDTGREVVRTAAASGRRVSHDLLAAVTGLGERGGDALDRALRAAIEIHVLEPNDRGYAFRHALLAEAVYDDLLPGEAVRLHGRYVAALADAPERGTAAELARHARAAHDLATALTASIQAGDEASAVGGPDEAAQHYEAALSLAAETAVAAQVAVDVGALTVKAGEALIQAGYVERAAALVAAQLERADLDPVARSRMLAARARALLSTDSVWGEESVELARRAAATLPGDAPVAVRARVLATQAEVVGASGFPQEAEAVGLEALELAERHDLPLIASETVTTLSRLRRSGPQEPLRAALRSAIDRATESGSLHAELQGRFTLARSFQDAGEFDEAAHWFRSALARAGALPWAPYAVESRWQLVGLQVTVGEWDDALALARGFGPGAEPPPLLRGLLESVALLVDQGRGVDIGVELGELRAFWQQEGSIVIQAAALEMGEAARGHGALTGASAVERAEAVLGSYDDAVEVLSEIWRPWFHARVRLAAVASAVLADLLPELTAEQRVELVAVSARLGRDGATVLDQYPDLSDRWGPEGRAWQQRLVAEQLRLRWLSGVDAPTADELRASWASCEAGFVELGHVYELATVRAAYAGILRSMGDPAAARDLAARAREAAEDLGARPLLDRLASGSGAAPPGETNAAETLTRREAEVLELVAEGRTNGEIAARLYISTKTVSVHVSRILAKLGAAGRTEAAAIARRRGLLPD